MAPRIPFTGSPPSGTGRTEGSVDGEKHSDTDRATITFSITLPDMVAPQIAVYTAIRVQALSIPWEGDSWPLPTKGLHTGSGLGKGAKLSSAPNSDVTPLWGPMHPSF